MQPEFEEIIASDLPELEKLVQAYRFLLKDQIAIAQREIELQKTVGDEENMIKQKIKQSTLEYSASIFVFCYRRITGRRLPNEQ